MDRHGIVPTSQQHVVEVAHPRHVREAPMPAASCTLGPRVGGLPKRQALRERGMGVGLARQDEGATVVEHQRTQGLVAGEISAQEGDARGRHPRGRCAQPAFARGSFTVLCGMPVLRHAVLRGQGDTLRLSGADALRGHGGMLREGLAMAELTGETGVAMHDVGRKVMGAIQGHQPWSTKRPKIGQHAVLVKARKDLNNHRIEGARRDRIEELSDLLVTGKLLHVEQGLGVMLPFGVLQPALVRHKRRRWGAKDAQGAQGGIVDGISGVGTRFTMVRSLCGPSVQDVLEDIEA